VIAYSLGDSNWQLSREPKLILSRHRHRQDVLLSTVTIIW